MKSLSKSKFKQSSFYKTFRMYWRSVENETAELRYITVRFLIKIFWIINKARVVKKNRRKISGIANDLNTAAHIKQYLLNSTDINPGRRLFIDVSNIIKNGPVTGIQRVVRSIMLQWLGNSPEQWKVQPVYASKYREYLSAHRFTLKLLGFDQEILQDVPICPQSGDIFFGLDMQPEVVIAHRHFYQRLRNKGVSTCFLVHDLLPVTMPQYFQATAIKYFHSWLEVISESNRLCCVSQTTAAVLGQWIEKNTGNQPLISWFHLGCEINKAISNSELAVELPASFNPQMLSFLVVGTLEPRKGHSLALDAFELLWKEGIKVNLVFAGREGWMVNDLIQRVEVHPERNTQLFWIADANDLYLQELYKTASCLLFPSEGEGFGLPLVEAAHFGTPIIARDLAVFREIAGDFATYFSHGAEELRDTIKQWMLLYQNKQVPQSSSIPRLSWEQSAQQLLSNVLPLN